MTSLKVTQAGLVSLLTFVVGKIVAYVPSLAHDQAAAISTGTLVIAVAFLAVNAVHAVVALVREGSSGKGVTLAEIEAGVRQLVRDELNAVLPSAVHVNAPSLDPEALKTEIARVVLNSTATAAPNALTTPADPAAPTAPAA